MTGVGEAGLGPAALYSTTALLVSAGRRHTTRPSLRSKARVSIRPSLKAVKKTRSPATTGEEYPEGTATFQTKLLAGPNPIGGLPVSETARPPGPRNCGQSSANVVSVNKMIATAISLALILNMTMSHPVLATNNKEPP